MIVFPLSTKGSALSGAFSLTGCEGIVAPGWIWAALRSEAAAECAAWAAPAIKEVILWDNENNSEVLNTVEEDGN